MDQRDNIFWDFLATLKELCNNTAPRRLLDDYLKVILVLYAWRHGAKLKLSDNGCLDGIVTDTDPLLAKLWQYTVVVPQNNDFGSFRALFIEYERFDRDEYIHQYGKIIKHLLTFYPDQLFNGTTSLPPFHISRTIAAYLVRHGCESVLNTNAGISSLALALPAGLEYRREESSTILSLIGDVLLDAANVLPPVKSTSSPDALVSILPVDYYFDNVRWHADCSSKGIMQAGFFESALKDRPAKKVIVGLIHYQVANQRSYSQRLDRDRYFNLRRSLAHSGFLDMVITYPNDVFQDAKVLTSLVFLDLEKKDDLITFITPNVSLDQARLVPFSFTDDDFDVLETALPEERAIVPASELEKTDWSLNAYVYVQPSHAIAPFKSVRLGDIAEIALDDFQLEAKDGHTIRPESYSASIVTAISQVPLRDPMYEYDHFKMVSGPAVFFRFAKDESLLACVNYTDNVCYFDDDCIAIRPKGNRVSLEYLVYLLLTNDNLRHSLLCLCEYYCDGFILRSHFNYLKVPILDDLKLQEEELLLYRSGTPEKFRDDFPEFFRAAGWADEKFGMKISDTISSYFRNNYHFPEDSANRPFNTIRTLTHDLIGKMQEMELVPTIDKGAVPQYLSKKAYKDHRSGSEYVLVKPLMPDDVVSALDYVCSVGREGSHEMIDGTNLRREVLKGFMKFTLWVFTNKTLFDKKGSGYFIEKTPLESKDSTLKPISGTVRRLIIHGTEYLYCENVHLFVDKRKPKIKEGDTVVIKRYVEENKEDLIERGLTLFANNERCYHKERSQLISAE